MSLHRAARAEPPPPSPDRSPGRMDRAGARARRPRRPGRAARRRPARAHRLGVGRPRGDRVRGRRPGVVDAAAAAGRGPRRDAARLDQRARPGCGPHHGGAVRRPLARRGRCDRRRALRLGRGTGARVLPAARGHRDPARREPVRRGHRPAAVAGRGGLHQAPHLAADDPAGARRRRPPRCRGPREGVTIRRGRQPRQRASGRRRPAPRARDARVLLRGPLQLLPRELPGVPPAAARGPRAPLGPLVAGVRRGRRGPAPGRRRSGRHGPARERRRATRAATSTTSACTATHGDAAWPRRCCTPSSPTPRSVAATGSGSRSTPTHRPAPTGSTARWAGRPTTSSSPGSRRLERLAHERSRGDGPSGRAE